MNKQILLSIICLCMVVSAMKAQTTYELWVAGTQVTSANCNDILGGGTIFYDPIRQSLTLNGVNITEASNAGNNLSDGFYAAIHSNLTGNIDVILQGENNINITNTVATYLNALDIINASSFTISGNGSLNIDVNNVNGAACGIYVEDGAAHIASGIININSSWRCMHTYEDLNINGGTLTCFGNEDALKSDANIIIATGLSIYEGNAAPGELVTSLSGNPTMKYVKITDGTNSLENNSVSDISVYPNPANNFINIQGVDAGSEIQIYNVLGSLVKTAVLNNDGSLNIEDLKNGMYVIKTSNISAKFVKN